MSTQNPIAGDGHNCRVTLTNEFLHDLLPKIFPSLEGAEFVITDFDKSNEVDGIVVRVRKAGAYAVCTRHWRRFAIAFTSVLQLGSGMYRVIADSFPENYTIVDIKLDLPNEQIVFLLQHESFGPVVLKPEEAMLKSALCASVPYIKPPSVEAVHAWPDPAAASLLLQNSNAIATHSIPEDRKIKNWQDAIDALKSGVSPAAISSWNENTETLPADGTRNSWGDYDCYDRPLNITEDNAPKAPAWWDYPIPGFNRRLPVGVSDAAIMPSLAFPAGTRYAATITAGLGDSLAPVEADDVLRTITQERESDVAQ